MDRTPAANRRPCRAIETRRRRRRRQHAPGFVFSFFFGSLSLFQRKKQSSCLWHAMTSNNNVLQLRIFVRPVMRPLIAAPHRRNRRPRPETERRFSKPRAFEVERDKPRLSPALPLPLLFGVSFHFRPLPRSESYPALLFDRLVIVTWLST